MSVIDYFSELIADRRKTPREDLLSTALGWKIDGEPIPDKDLLEFCLLMFMAGLDTVAAQLTYSSGTSPPTKPTADDWCPSRS